jgi:plastocyanin
MIKAARTWSARRVHAALPLCMAVTLLVWHAAPLALAAEPRPARRPVTHTIIIDAVAYSPSTLVVHQGDTVVWINRDPFPHTATAVDGTFDSKMIAVGKSWRHVARIPGVHKYACTFHPTVKGPCGSAT